MERKKINELTQLKIMNCDLALANLRLQANRVMDEKNTITLKEFKRLKCKVDEWQLDKNTWELFKKVNENTGH